MMDAIAHGDCPIFHVSFEAYWTEEFTLLDGGVYLLNDEAAPRMLDIPRPLPPHRFKVSVIADHGTLPVPVSLPPSVTVG